jgi:hypothetical protein
MSADEIATALQGFGCVYEDAKGERSGIGCIRLEEIDDKTVFVFVSDEVQIREDGADS